MPTRMPACGLRSRRGATLCLSLMPRFRVAVISQNTLFNVASAVMRDWRMYWAKACMTA
jgi:hypothetical protein